MGRRFTALVFRIHIVGSISIKKRFRAQSPGCWHSTDWHSVVIQKSKRSERL
jgi:hypothetical protein